MIRSLLRKVREAGDRRFDRKFGIETSGPADDCAFSGMDPDVGRDAVAYGPIGRSRFRRLVRVTRVNATEFHFVDLGSGKGRALLLADSHGFKTVTGIEADIGLCEVARANVAAWTKRFPGAAIGVIHGDARTAPLPEGDLFVLLHNPFTGAVLAEVARRLADIAGGRNRRVIIAYSGDAEGDALARSGAFHRVRLRPLAPWSESSMSLFFNAVAKQQ